MKAGEEKKEIAKRPSYAIRSVSRDLVEEMEERESYVAFILSRGAFKSQVKKEIYRRYGLKARSAENLITAARRRLHKWTTEAGENMKQFSINFYHSVVTGPEKDLTVKMQALRRWEELMGVGPDFEGMRGKGGGVTVVIQEETITDKSQIRDNEDDLPVLPGPAQPGSYPGLEGPDGTDGTDGTELDGPEPD